MATEQIIALASAVTSVAAAFVSAYLSFRSLRAQGQANLASAVGVRNQYFAELRRWADEACVCFSEASHLCELDPSRTKDPNFFERAHRLRIQLSAAIDRGRWFFPNHHVEGVGEHRQGAFQGYRHEVLDSLVAAYRLVGTLDHRNPAAYGQVKGLLAGQRAAFITQIQDVLDPRAAAEEFRLITRATAPPPGR